MNLTDCSQLSPYKCYKQAQQILHSTTRASNPNWYSDALATETQLHIFIGSDTGAISYIHNQKEGSWTKGPNLTPQLMRSYEQLEEVLDALIEAEVKSKHPALGITLYIADEFATAELGEEHQNPAELENLRQLIIDDPTAVLNDSTLSNETHSWRLFPYPGADGSKAFATAISFSRVHEEFMQNARNYGIAKDTPVLTRAVSAPLCTITALPWLLENIPPNGFVTALHYPRFTVLAFFNPKGDLIFIRTLQHHGNSPYPANIGNAIMITANSLELEKPHIFILPMAGRPPEGMSSILSNAAPGSAIITLSPTSSPLHIPTAPNSAPKSDLPGVTRAWKWSDLHATPAEESTPELAEDTPSSAIPGVTRPWKIQDMEAVSMLQQVRLEVVAVTNPPAASQSTLASTHTFSTLISEMWPIQDFLPNSKEQVALYPDATGMRILAFSKYFKLLGTVATLCFAAYTVWQLWTFRQNDAWTFEPELAAQELNMLQQRQTQFESIQNIMQPRAAAWSHMELLFHLFPKNSRFKIKSFKYDINPNKIIDPNSLGFIKKVTIQGLADEQAITQLNLLNSDSEKSKLFTAISDAIQDPSLKLEPISRIPEININTQKNPRYSQQSETHLDTSYPSSFSLEILQSYNPGDLLSFQLSANP